jgi:hypothetical protein
MIWHQLNSTDDDAVISVSILHILRSCLVNDLASLSNPALLKLASLIYQIIHPSGQSRSLHFPLRWVHGVREKSHGASFVEGRKGKGTSLVPIGADALTSATTCPPLFVEGYPGVFIVIAQRTDL